jgi:hypothetical protein
MPVAYKNGTAIIIKMKDIQPSPIRRDTTASATVTLASRLIHASTKNASSVARLHAGSPYRFGASASAGAFLVEPQGRADADGEERRVEEESPRHRLRFNPR